MLRYFLLIILLFSTLISIDAQDLIINELDADTPGVDNQEFIELKSITPNFSTDGFVLVFFNGSTSGGDTSYLAYDLSGFTTDSNGLLVLGSTGVSPFPQIVINESVIQNGADAVAIYSGTLDMFPGGTLATQTNLIDALVYGTNDATDDGLLALLGKTIQHNDNGTNANPKSIQRFVDDMGDVIFSAELPTPRMPNDGSGIVFNPVSITVDQSDYNEGDSFTITFTSETNVTSDLNFNINLDNGTFNISDFSGDTNLTIPNGQNTISTTITLTDDTIDEGDEVLRIQFIDLVEPIIASNNLVEVRVVDNDFTTAAWGTPVNPTFGLVTSTQPNGYYNSLDGLADLDLRQAIQDIIADPNVVRAQTYADVIDILKLADQNPENSNEVWLVYTEEGRSKLDFQTSSSNVGKWNREHTFPLSRAGYNGIDADDIADGIDVFFLTEADSLRHGYSDAHALRAVDGSENSSRGSRHYGAGEYIGPSGTLGSFRGDVARGVLFLELRYNGLEVIDGFTTSTGQMGDLATLLDWHRNDPPDDFEMNRNNIVFEWQKNRNPLIDQPLLVEFIWGNRVGDVWQQTLSANENNTLNIDVYPNPTDDRIFIKGLNEPAEIKVFSVEGKELLSETVSNNTMDLKLSSGLYLIEIVTDKGSAIKRIIVK
ncbi:endonuclease [Winogradskyella immobilis]|uniref:Endonuclease n=1 Tax=Winogradskyella immobilis TaxID=2816852 RepID=A0ABS8ENM6_9FLAO|nr:endonuclease [Winogradskyella immobilis]MCC1484462.1 endonuclease [Winogradskyella immobilis]MCG0016554.1 endonuclease [Winogradskyella immobilis]